MGNGIDSCSCDCQQPASLIIPSIIGSGQVTVDTSVENVVNINAPENSSVTSNDGSITITQTLNSPGSTNYDLAINKPDKNVGACNNDPNPSTLDNKIFVTSPLTKSVQDCGTDGKVIIGVDESLLSDEKVKVSSGCTAGYLEDAIEGTDGIRVYRDGCVMKADVDPEYFVKPMAKLTLLTDVEYTFSHGSQATTENEGWFFLPMASEIDNNTEGRSDWITFEDKVLSPISPGAIKVIKINKDGYYRVSFNFNADINYGVNAIRGCVFSDSDSKAVILDDKIGEPSGYALNNQATTDASLNQALAKQVSFSRSDVTFLQAGSMVLLGGRVAPYVIHGPGSGQDAWILVRRAGLAGGILGLGPVLENNEAGTVLTVEWVSDPDGGLLYI